MVGYNSSEPRMSRRETQDEAACERCDERGDWREWITDDTIWCHVWQRCIKCHECAGWQNEPVVEGKDG